MQNENSLERVVFSLYILFVILFLGLYITVYPYPLSFLVKAVPAASLLIFTLTVKRGTVRTLLAAGLFFSLAGDVLLDLDRSRYFIYGLACFLLAHAAYTLLFLRNFRFRAKSLPIIAAVVVYASILAFLLRNMDPRRIIPVMVYLAVISLMTISAAFYSTGRSWKGADLVVTGAGLFMLSDSVIAVNQFLHPIPYSLMISLPLYWAAQLLIVRGIQISD
jgi:uncharacterized membrane protein YhhN